MNKIAFLIAAFFLTVTANAATQSLSLSSHGGELMFSKTSLTAKANQPVKLTFKNASAKDSGLTHNWILAKPGTAEQISAASISAGADKGWLADSPDVIAHTKLLNPGESQTINFTAPAAGDYPYFCSYPGHAATMKGVLHVK